jgi:hypothetical protein
MYLNNSNDSILQAFYFAMLEENIDLLSQIKYYLENNDSTNAEIINSSVTPENYFEENEKLFNEVYINTWGKYNMELDSAHIEILEEIAYQNPISGGDAVYGARVMLDLDLLDTYSNPNGRYTLINEDMTLSKLIKNPIMPNPSSGKFTYLRMTNSTFDDRLEVYNLFGVLLKSMTIPYQVGAFNFDLTDLPNGIYPCKISSNDKMEIYEKLIIQK